MPGAHRKARRLAAAGVRGAKLYTRLAAALTPLPDGQVVRLPTKAPLLLDVDDWISLNGYFGLYERAEFGVLRALIRPGDVAVDVGANIGYWTLHFAQWVGSGGRVVAVEPSERCLRSLRRALAAAGDCTVEVVPAAVGSVHGTAEFTGCDHPRHSGLGTTGVVANGRSATRVPVRPLSAILGEQRVDRCSFMKLDVEGAELEALFGLGHLLHTGAVESLLVEISPEFLNPAALAGALSRLDPSYRFLRVEERGPIRRRPALIPVHAGEIASATTQFNLLAVNAERSQSVKHFIVAR